jgi:Holliday junction resolvasome RuvABC endonuclease subunit
MRRVTRTVGVDPTRRSLCFAAFEGRDLLVDWGCLTTPGMRDTEVKRALHKLMDQVEPDFVALELCRGTRRGVRARGVIEVLRYEALECGAAVRFVTRSEVKAAFGPRGNTKQEIALAIAEEFPALERILPPKRKRWSPEDDRMNIFDAASFALAALPKIERGTLMIE